ncbi:MAG: hypothetical protein KGL11_15070 [Alphaproteobacteria bacterium]|nr:hypothetical protein [Alphaproteobacteria bacterium]
MKSVFKVGAAALIAAAVSGCVPIIGGLTLSELFTGSSLVATGLTGKSLTDDALGAVTGEDCSMMDAALEKDRNICETRGSPATAGDFKGLIGMAGASPAAPQATTEPATAATVHAAADAHAAVDVRTSDGAWLEAN